jgi:prophage antirepressor-like protein
MTIFNEILKVNNQEIILIFDKDMNIWFGLRDIINVLGYSNYEKSISNIKITNTNKLTYNKINKKIF